MRNDCTRQRLKWLLPFLLVALVFAPQIGKTALALANYTFAYAPAKQLRNPTHLSRGLRSYGYVGSVGGVAFGGLAVGEGGQKVAGLSYDPSRPDGQRLRVTVTSPQGKEQTVVASIYDWQLVPIARFAREEQHASFTLFGKLEDPEDEKQRLARGERVLNYHPAFFDTLLGLRLFQADVVLLYEAAADLPKDEGKHVLGAGEAMPNVNANMGRLAAVHAVVDELNKTQGGRFRSYVICDDGQQVQFTAAGGVLTLSGYPLWYCWRFSKSIDGEELDRRVKSSLIAELESDAASLSQDALARRYTEEHIQARRKALSEQIIDAEYLESMPQHSRRLSDAIRENGGINPAVYDALVTTMRYTALFRHAKAASPEAYARFVASLDGVVVTPPVRTPTVLIPSGS
ncbi:MAG: hypothetical protein ACYDA8_16415 [Deferrisomatales bacterium]